jgi:hypothetical protein
MSAGEQPHTEVTGRALRAVAPLAGLVAPASTDSLVDTLAVAWKLGYVAGLEDAGTAAVQAFENTLTRDEP